MYDAVMLRQVGESGARGIRVLPALRAVRAALLVGLAYYLGAKVGLALTFQTQAVSTLWPPNAILLAAFLLTPARSWWLLLLAVFPVHLAVELRAGVPLPMVLCWYVSNCSEALIGALLVRRFATSPPWFDSFLRISIFFMCAALVAPFLSSFLDAAFVRLNHWGTASYLEVWRMRFFSNVLAILTLVPVIVTWADGGIVSLREAPPRRYAEACLLAVGLLAVGIVVFSGQKAGPGTTPALLYAPLPFLLWAAVRFGPGGAATSLLLIVLLAIWGAIHGRGSFDTSSAEANALSIQLLFIVMSITLLSLAALIRERERAEDTARRTGEQLQLALDAAQLGTWDWHIPDKTAVWSDKSMRILGLTGGEPRIALERLYALIHPDDRRAVSQIIRRARESGAPYESEFRVLRPDGSIRWVLGKGEVQYDRAGRPVRMLGVTADITARKRAEAFSAGQSRVLEMIATGASLVNILTSLVKLVESQSEGLLCSILLLGEDRLHLRLGAAPSLPESYIKAVESVSIGPLAELCGTAMSFGKPVITTDMLRDPLWVSYRHLASQHGLHACSSNPIVSQQGQVLGSLAMYYRDVRSPCPDEAQLMEIATQIAGIAIERDHAEEALRESQQRYRLATASANVGVWDWNLETNDFYVDPHLKAILGYRNHEIGNRIADWERLVFPEDADRVLERARACLAGESLSCEVEYRMLHRDGSVRWFLARGSAVRDESGKLCRMVGTDTDVTERKRAEFESQEQRMELAHLGRVAMLGELSGALAHELNQPLSAIMANVGAAQRFLAQSPPDMFEVRQILEDIVHDDQRAGEVIVRLRALMKKEDLRLQWLGLNEVLGEVLDLLHSDLIQRRVSIDRQLAPSLPPVLADRVQLQQVLLNLILNACDAMGANAPGERRITLVTALAPDAAVQLAVADRGTGIPEGKVERIFEPFFTSKEHGMGLGLAICRSIVEVHGGRLRAVNNPDGGATFHLALPGAEPDHSYGVPSAGMTVGGTSSSP
jgi:PAS domain S-box-containing protein